MHFPGLRKRGLGKKVPSLKLDNATKVATKWPSTSLTSTRSPRVGYFLALVLLLTPDKAAYHLEYHTYTNGKHTRHIKLACLQKLGVGSRDWPPAT